MIALPPRPHGRTLRAVRAFFRGGPPRPVRRRHAGAAHPCMLPVAVLVVAVAVAGCDRKPPSDRIRVSGHVEATEVQAAAEVGGRVLELPFNEGDRVRPGDVLARLDTQDLVIALARATAERDAADAQLRLLQAGSRGEDIRQSEAQASAARADVQAIRSELDAAEADLSRFDALLAANSGSRKQRDDAATRRDVAAQRVAGAQDRVRAAEEVTARLRAGARRQEIDAARARVAVAAAAIQAIEKSIADATFHAPAGGIVTQKLVEAGEMVGPRAPVAVIADLDRAWADVFVPEPTVPLLKIGQPATLFTDAGGQGIAGTVTFISAKAEFTPRNVQTADERSKLVYRVKVTVDNRNGVLKQGMPVEAELPTNHQ